MFLDISIYIYTSDKPVMPVISDKVRSVTYFPHFIDTINSSRALVKSIIYVFSALCKRTPEAKNSKKRSNDITLYKKILYFIHVKQYSIIQ